MMKMRDPPPAVVFKYLRSCDYEKYYKKGSLRLGVNTFYRKQYECGSGFGDAFDGVRSAAFPAIGQRAVAANRCYLFCVARSYSYEAHTLWMGRKDCDYDLCIALDGNALMSGLAAATKAAIGPRLMACGACNYGDHQNQVNSLQGNLIGDAFLKPASYAKEDEYRFAVLHSPQDPEEPLNLVVPALATAVLQLICLKPPAESSV